MNDQSRPDGTIHYACRRFTDRQDAPARFQWQPTGEFHFAEPETFEFFLIERYLLYSTGRSGELSTGRVWHLPYPIQAAQLTCWDETPLELNGFKRPGRKPENVLASSGVSVEVFGLQARS